MMLSQGRGDTPVIHRVLNLRKQMEIDNDISTADPRDTIFFPSQLETSERTVNIPNAHNLLWEPPWSQGSVSDKEYLIHRNHFRANTSDC